MVELPAGAPIQLSWFIAWATLSLFLAFVQHQFLRDDGQLKKEVAQRSARHLDLVNTFLQQELDLTSERPVNERRDLGKLLGHVRDAWVPGARYGRFLQVNRLGRILCVTHSLLALGGGGAWWAIEGQRELIAWVDGSVFGSVLAIIVAGIGFQIWCHISLSENVDEV